MREGCETRAARVAHEARLTGVAGATPLARLERVRLFGARLELRAIVAMPVRQEAAELPQALAALAEGLGVLEEHGVGAMKNLDLVEVLHGIRRRTPLGMV